MALNFNVDPYYDDFDPSKNFHRILFKPGVAVQARELTQSQTILQSQISKFADNIFSQNTPVTGGQVTVNQNCYYLKLNAQYNSVDIVAGDFTNKIIQDSTGQVIAKVIKTAEATGTDAAAGDPPTLIVTYLSGGQFSDGMDIFPADGSNFAATIIGTIGGSTGIGLSSVASISDGVFYIVNGYSQSSTQNEDGSYTRYSIGNFVSVQPQTTILDKYSSTPYDLPTPGGPDTIIARISPLIHARDISSRTSNRVAIRSIASVSVSLTVSFLNSTVFATTCSPFKNSISLILSTSTLTSGMLIAN